MAERKVNIPTDERKVNITVDERKVDIPHVIGTASAFVGLVLLVVALATPGWTSAGGLPEGGPAAVQATRGMCVFGTLNLVFGITFSVTLILKKPARRPTICAAVMIAGGLLGAIGAAIFTGYQLTSVPSIPFGYAFYLAWVQTVFSMGGGVVILCAERKVTEEEYAAWANINSRG